MRAGPPIAQRQASPARRCAERAALIQAGNSVTQASVVSRVRSIEVHYELSGPVDAPVLVLSGPLGSALEIWQPLVERLAERFRVLRYDHRGHGRSAWRGSYIPDEGPIEVRPIPYGSYAIVNMAFDVLALMDRLNIERAAFCGVELGGVIGIWLATHVPERLSSLVLGSTSAHYGDHGGPWMDRAWLVKIGAPIAWLPTW